MLDEKLLNQTEEQPLPLALIMATIDFVTKRPARTNVQFAKHLYKTQFLKMSKTELLKEFDKQLLTLSNFYKFCTPKSLLPFVSEPSDDIDKVCNQIIEEQKNHANKNN